jgi:Mce-associated membrane protein
MAGSNTDTATVKSAKTELADADTDHMDDPPNTSIEGSAGEDANNTTDEQVADKRKGSRGRAQRRLSISLSARSLVSAAVVAILVGAVATFAWLYVDARRELDAQHRKLGYTAHAEQVALDYAVNAATMNFTDLNGWKTKLVAGTSPKLNDKLTKAAESMEQILVPLQWNSTAQPLIAKVRSDTDGTYVVDCFVSVQTKTAQAPDALRSTATYSLTIDPSKNWQITDVGGIGSVAGQK